MRWRLITKGGKIVGLCAGTDEDIIEFYSTFAPTKWSSLYTWFMQLHAQQLAKAYRPSFRPNTCVLDTPDYKLYYLGA